MKIESLTIDWQKKMKQFIEEKIVAFLGLGDVFPEQII
jgi:hypothetical protein